MPDVGENNQARNGEGKYPYTQSVLRSLVRPYCGVRAWGVKVAASVGCIARVHPFYSSDSDAALHVHAYLLYTDAR